MGSGYAGLRVVTSLVHCDIANDSQKDTPTAYEEATLAGLGALTTSGDPECTTSLSMAVPFASSGSANPANIANIFSGLTRKAGAIALAAPYRMSLSSGSSN